MIHAIAPIVAGLCYGGWAAFANMEHGNEAALMAFAVQGSFAFTSTLLLTKMVARAVKRNPQQVNKLGIFAMSAILLFAIPFGIHLIAGTPDILQAMLPGLIIGNTYVWLLINQFTAELASSKSAPVNGPSVSTPPEP